MKIIFISIGFICVGLGTIGIVLPLLPTTPFYLLATFCFAKGSTRFHQWFTNTTLYKKHLENYTKTRSMTITTKLSILIPVTIMLSLVFVFIDILIMKIVIVILLLIKYWYFIFVIKTIEKNENYEKVNI